VLCSISRPNKLFALVAILLSVAIVGCSSSSSTSNSGPAPILPITPANITSTVSLTGGGRAIPQHFLGYSMDSTVLVDYAGTGTTADPALVNLLTAFTPFNGAVTLRPSATPATTGSSNVSTSFLTALASLEAATASPLIVTIGLGSYNPTYAGNVASGVVSRLGSTSGLAFELGNEPDLLVTLGNRPSSYTYTQYQAEYAGYEAAVSPSFPGRNAAGMAAGTQTWDTANLGTFLAAEGSTLSVITSHEYPLSICSGTGGVTVDHLLSDNIATAFVRRYQPLVAVAAPYGIPVRAGEMNSVSCGGLAGVSDTFASALWLADSLFELDSVGVAGMNLHTGSASTSVPDQSYNAFYVNGSQVTVRPSYYGMLLFARAIQSSASLLTNTIQQDSTQNVKVWATLDSKRVARVLVLEKDLTTGTQIVDIDLGSTATSAGRTYALTDAQGVTATTGVSLAGQTYDGTTTGLPVGALTTSSITSSGGKYRLTVPNGSALLLEVQLP
jgi:hypothetical protein